MVRVRVRPNYPIVSSTSLTYPFDVQKIEINVQNLISVQVESWYLGKLPRHVVLPCRVPLSDELCNNMRNPSIHSFPLSWQIHTEGSGMG